MPQSSDPTDAAHHFLSGCVQAGLGHVIVSPGSRSTPLTIAASRIESLDVFVHLDERSAAFAALGQAKVSGHPVALLCTSGTAAANYLPAVAEGAESRVPLLVMTADRPPEHIGWGVGQAFDQVRIFGTHVRAEMMMPVGGDGGLAHAQRAGLRATSTAIDELGPVHVNWPFRLPVDPGSTRAPPPPALRIDRTPDSRAGDEGVSKLSALLADSSSPVIVGGPTAVRPGPHAHRTRDAIWQFCRTNDIPIIADVLSGLRNPPPDVPVVDAADLLVATASAPSPDLVIRIGGTPTAKSLRLWWEGLDGADHVLIDPHSAWQDPSHIATQVFTGAVDALLNAVGRVESPTRSTSDAWLERAAAARVAADRVLDDVSEVTEAHIARELGRWMPTGTVLVASSSMPVRDVDTFLVTDSPCEVFSNRGINGIDGVISTAIGVGRARPGAELVVLIGDLALLHDVGGLLDAARRGVAMTVVVPNNDGGGIFSFLPIRSAIDESTYQRYFHTPHGTTFDFLAGHVGITHSLVTTTDELSSELRATRSQPVRIIEVPIDTNHNVTVHRDVTAGVARTLR